MDKDFREIAHSGGKLTFHIYASETGHVQYQIEFSGNRPVPLVLIQLYATSNGIPVAPIKEFGIGVPWSPAPFPGCLPVFVTSDSEGHFGHQCPHCSGYWRGGPWPAICPYCGSRSSSDFAFLSKSQKKYLTHYCRVLWQALEEAKDGKVVIDMDAVADAIDSSEKPAFYVSEESQQLKFDCGECGQFNDVIGSYCYCSSCGTRHDLMQFTKVILPVIRDRLNQHHGASAALCEAVAAFDAFVSQYASQLVEHVPMLPARSVRLTRQGFQDLAETARVLKEWFGIELFSGMDDGDVRFAVIKFHRRHLYTHKGGQVDEKYLRDSSDKTVRLNEAITESREDTHQLISLVARMAGNLHQGFHEILPPDRMKIEAHQGRMKSA